MSSEGEKQGAGKGFSGLSSLVSDVDSAVTSAKQEVSRPSAEGEDSQNADATSQSVSTEEPEADHQPYQHAAQQPAGGSTAGKWLLGIGAVVGVIWLLSSGSGNKSAPPPSTASPTLPPAQVGNSEPAPNWHQQAPVQPQESLQSGSQQNATAEDLAARMLGRASSQPQAPDRPFEDKPPVGTNHVLGVAQIRYCLAEGIRLEAAKGSVNNYVETDVDRFNAMVADYNSRCGEFRYRRGTLESARSEVERNRRVLEAEGRSRFARSPSVGARSTATESPRRLIEASRDRENFRTCISGEYPSLCNHSLLTRDEALQVAAAEKRANFRTCVSGEYPSLCNHSLLTREEAVQVEAAERNANYRTCISGEYPSLCNHSLLTRQEAMQVNAAEKKANFQTCISGEYPSLCNHTLLTREEAIRVAEAERRVGNR